MPTVPEPFELTNAGEKKRVIMKEIKEREMQECTF